MRKLTKKLVNQVSYEIIGAAIEVHKTLGPGLLESNYEKALVYELNLRGLETQSQKKITVDYKGMKMNCDLRYDILVEDLIVVENKAVINMHPVFSATVMSYMHHLQKPKGILLNFHVQNLFKEGQKTFVNKFFAALPNE